MDAQILCTLLAQRIPPEQFQLWGNDVHWMSPDFDTKENRAIVEEIKANYPELAAAYEAKQTILQEIVKLESLQTPRRIREAITDPTWMNGIDKQIRALRANLK
jgi:ABC-type branched-subunit amino acid transport system substrate-binding protein